MPELTAQERLQPSLLDRLTDDAPDEKKEAREQRVLSLSKLREGVRRDLGWLLDTGCLGSVEDLSAYPLVAASVVNYGIPELAGHTLSDADATALERVLRQAIVDFEPRILRDSLKVRSVVSREQMSNTALAFVIEGELWAQPVPLELYLRTEIDLETGTVRVSDASRADAG